MCAIFGIIGSYELDEAKKAARLPMACPECGEAMKLPLDKKMYPIHKKCSLCVAKYESKLKLEGKYQDYVREMVSKNMITHLEEAEQFIEDFRRQSVDTYVTEDGEVEDWSGKVDKSQIIDKWKEELKEMKKMVDK